MNTCCKTVHAGSHDEWKARRREQAQARYHVDPEYQRMASQRWREKNLERRYEQQREYRELNRDTLRAQQRERYARDPEYRERVKAWGKLNPERRRVHAKRWYDANRGYLVDKARRRWLRKRDVAVVQYRSRDIYERDNWLCGLCRKRVNRLRRHPDPMSPSIDHILPISLGGTDEPSNVRLAHLRCNVVRGNRGDVQLRLLA